ncbi:MAG: family 78 glycoside hydrolase catalytic domain [Bacteroidales bacterium]|nr:family 78 glycoside hydrolase catalytic domain [Bacteroidales bacterium]
MKITAVLVCIGIFISMQAEAKIRIENLSCNGQHETAVATGELNLHWQIIADKDEPTDALTYEITIVDGSDGKTVALRKTAMLEYGRQSITIDSGALAFNPSGYIWSVKATYASGKSAGKSATGQKLFIVPTENAFGNAKWIGAITKTDANIPDGRWSNSDYKKESFKNAWANTRTDICSRSITVNKTFKVNAPKINGALLLISGLGHYEVSINDKKVSDDMFAPLWSEYDKTVYYNAFDVRNLLKTTENNISVMLGNGFFNVIRGDRYAKLQTSYGAPQMIMRLIISYNDGSTQEVVSGDNWSYMFNGITFNSIYGGESYDATLEEAPEMHRAVLTEGPRGTLTPQTAPPVRIMERYGVKQWLNVDKSQLAEASKKTKREIAPSVKVADMGQNLAGFPQITVRGKRGQKITLVVSENLNEYGVCDQRQIGRQHFYEYTLKGSGEETWHPHFSYYGYRYVQVEGAALKGEANPDNLPVLNDLQSCFVYSSAKEVSAFECDNEIFNVAHRLIERAERSNMQAVLTDCPHREKLGWLEQDHLCGPSLLMNFDMEAYVPKIIRDIADTQKENGMVPTIAPQYVSFGNLFDDSPEWSATLIALPYMYYERYGDDALLREYYPVMLKYLDYLQSRARFGILDYGLGDWYDYGPWKAGFSRNTPIALVATAHYILSLQQMLQIAMILNKNADIERLALLAAYVIEAFNAEFYHADSCYYGTNSQTSNALPLFLGIAMNPDGVMKNLVADIEKHGNRLTTGDVGNRYLFQVLARNNQNELLYKMLNHNETPGYGFQALQGATTLTEQWDPRQGASWNHFMMGQVDEWFFGTLAGIGQAEDSVGMQHLVIKPTLPGDMKRVHAKTETKYGTVEVTATNEKVTVSIPYGCDAEIITPRGSHSVTHGTYTF